MLLIILHFFLSFAQDNKTSQVYSKEYIKLCNFANLISEKVNQQSVIDLIEDSQAWSKLNNMYSDKNKLGAFLKDSRIYVNKDKKIIFKRLHRAFIIFQWDRKSKIKGDSNIYSLKLNFFWTLWACNQPAIDASEIYTFPSLFLNYAYLFEYSKPHAYRDPKSEKMIPYCTPLNDLYAILIFMWENNISFPELEYFKLKINKVFPVRLKKKFSTRTNTKIINNNGPFNNSIITPIAVHLHTKDLLNLSQTCKSNYAIITNNHVIWGNRVTQLLHRSLKNNFFLNQDNLQSIAMVLDFYPDDRFFNELLIKVFSSPSPLP